MGETTKQYGIIPARLNWEAVDFDRPIYDIPEEHRALYLRDYSASFPEHYGSMRQRFNGAITPAHGRLFAVGATPQAAIYAFWQSRGVALATIVIGDDLDYEDGNFFDWGFYVTVGEEGTGCKVAGMDVPGGSVLTWWK